MFTVDVKQQHNNNNLCDEVKARQLRYCVHGSSCDLLGSVFFVGGRRGGMRLFVTRCRQVKYSVLWHSSTVLWNSFVICWGSIFGGGGGLFWGSGKVAEVERLCVTRAGDIQYSEEFL